MFIFILLNGFLFVFTYLAGCIPISFNLSAAKLRVLTVFSAGLLLGAALTVIIPEGFDSLYQSQVQQQAAVKSVDIGDTLNNHGQDENPIKRLARNGRFPETVNKQPDSLQNAIQPSEIKPPGVKASEETQSDQRHYHVTLSVHQQTGLALLVGYLLMLLIDQMTDSLLNSILCSSTIVCFLDRVCCVCFRRRGTTFPMTSVASSTSLSDTPASGFVKTCGPLSSSSTTATIGSGLGHQPRMTATIGLIFHSFADGLALGAAFAVDRLQVEVVLFLAIFLHKLPAAFGLACYLIHEGFQRDQIRAHMACFSAASPLAALCTYAFLSVSQTSSSSVGETNAETMSRTGIALLLSGGTFLYVAASHVLPELIIQSRDITGQSGLASSQLLLPASSSTTTASESMVVGSQALHQLHKSSSDYPTAHYTMGGSHEPLLVYSTTGPHHLRHQHRSGTHGGGTRPPHFSCLELTVLLLGCLVPTLATLGHSH